MERVEELEQLKKEYQEIPIPEHGIDGVKAALERARQKKRLKTRLISYASMAAAAALVLFVVPKVGYQLFAGGTENSEAEDFYYNNNGKDMVSSNIKTESFDAVEDSSYQTGGQVTAAPQNGCETSQGWSPDAKDEGLENAENAEESFLLDEAIRRKISDEILRQIEARKGNGEEAFLANASYMQAFAGIDAEQNFYINNDGMVVIVFAPGEIASEVYGKIEFIIPNEVWK